MSLLGDPASFICNRCLPVDWAARSKVCQGLLLAESELLGHYQANEPATENRILKFSVQFCGVLTVGLLVAGQGHSHKAESSGVVGGVSKSFMSSGMCAVLERVFF